MLISHSASGRALARSIAARLADIEHASESHARPGRTLAARVRTSLDACELLLVLLDENAARSAWLHQEIGYALARGARVLVVARGPVERALLADAKPVAWPRSAAEVDALAGRVRGALPATPRRTIRSLAQTPEDQWRSAVRDELTRELRAHGWKAIAIGGAWEGERRVFTERIPDVVWRKKVRGRYVYLRPRVAPFNPVDLLTVRARIAPRVYEWWLLRTGRSDTWMRKLYRGAAEPITAMTRYFGEVAPAAGPGTSLIARRFLTERIGRTGELAGELTPIEAWMRRAASPPRRIVIASA